MRQPHLFNRALLEKPRTETQGVKATAALRVRINIQGFAICSKPTYSDHSASPRPPIQLFLLILMGLGLLLCTACGQSKAGPAIDHSPARDTLLQVIREQRHLYVIHGTGSPQSAQVAARLQAIIDNTSGWLSFTLLADTTASDSLLSVHPHLLVGTPSGNQWLHTWRDQLPFQTDDAAIHLARYTLDPEEDVLSVALYPSPANRQMPLYVLTAQREQAILDWLSGTHGPEWDNPLTLRWNYQIVGGQQRKVVGMFTDDWQVGGDPHWDFSHDPQPNFESPHVRIYQQQTRLGAAQLTALTKEVERRIQDLREWLGASELPLRPISLHVYPSSEHMAMMHNVQAQAFSRPERHEVHRVINDHYNQKRLHSHEDLRPFIRQAMGTPASKVLETGLAVSLTPNWMRNGHQYWGARLAAAKGTLTLAQLFGEVDYDTNSPLIKDVMAGVLIDFLIDTWDKQTFLTHYATWEPDVKELQRHESAWQRFLTRLARTYSRESWPYQPANDYRGMTLAHEGYSIYNGYGSDSAKEALSRLQRLHVNSIALVPYAGARSTKHPLPFGVSQRAGSENDAATVGSFIHAQQLGMQTLLKPQIWFWGGWPGDVEMSNEADWQQFFLYYREWIMHYAMLAAVHEMDALCAGVEFAKATLSHPEEWRQLIRDLRQVYAGPVTYAANWGSEAEKLAFGTELDFIGVNCYYPLSKEKGASEADLRKGFARIKSTLKAISQQHDRPVVLTEVGFRCVTDAWTNPHAEPQGRKFDEEAQRLSYEVILSSLHDAAWCQGMFWWKWPTYLGYAARNPRSFTPCHRPAAEVLKRWYGERRE